jgi:CTP:molybdopterin cytidylyltransferase MocA
MGARALVEASGLEIRDVEIGEGAHFDIDTREALRRVGATER